MYSVLTTNTTMWFERKEKWEKLRNEFCSYHLWLTHDEDSIKPEKMNYMVCGVLILVNKICRYHKNIKRMGVLDVRTFNSNFNYTGQQISSSFLYSLQSWNDELRRSKAWDEYETNSFGWNCSVEKAFAKLIALQIHSNF